MTENEEHNHSENQEPAEGRKDESRAVETYKEPAVHEKKSGSPWYYFLVVAVVFLAIGFFVSNNFTGQVVGVQGGVCEVTTQISGEEVRLTGTQVGEVCVVGDNDVSKKVTEYINQYLLRPGYELVVGNVEEENGMYKIEMNLSSPQGEIPVFSYVTLDGKLLFINQPFELDKEIEIPEQPEEPEPEPVQKVETPVVDFYIMSYCPYGQQFANNFYEVVKVLGDNIEVNPHYVIYSDYRSGYPNYCIDEENQLCSMHGVSELNEDIRQMCVLKYFPDKYWDYIMGIIKNCQLNEVDTCWEAQAEAFGINTETVETCFMAESETLAAADLQLNRDNGVSGSPTIFINGERYQGSRNPEIIKKAICDTFIDPPEACTLSLEGTGQESATGSC